MDEKKQETKDKKQPRLAFAIFAVLACLIFYGIFLFNTEILPLLTDHRFKSEWIYVFIAAIPMLLVLVIFFSDKISEISFGKDGLGIKFGNDLPPSLIETVDLNKNLAREYLLKGTRDNLDLIVKSLGRLSSPPVYLLVPIEELSIDFRILRQYIYKLSAVAPIKFIVFVGKRMRYLGFMTIERFKAQYPKFGIEIMLEDLEINEVLQADLPPIFRVDLNPKAIENYLNRLVYAQWKPVSNQRRKNDTNRDLRVYPSDLLSLGASDLKVSLASSPINVYWLLMENDLFGVPVINEDGIFIGLITRDRVTQSVILQLLQKSKKVETKE